MDELTQRAYFEISTCGHGCVHLRFGPAMVQLPSEVFDAFVVEATRVLEEMRRSPMVQGRLQDPGN